MSKFKNSPLAELDNASVFEADTLYGFVGSSPTGITIFLVFVTNYIYFRIIVIITL